MSNQHLPRTRHFEVEMTDGDGTIVVRTRGELDLASAPDLRKVLQDLRARKASVLLDLRDLTFMDSSGLRLIWDADVASRADGLDLKLTVPPPEVMRVFELTGLHKRLPFTDAG